MPFERVTIRVAEAGPPSHGAIIRPPALRRVAWKRAPVDGRNGDVLKRVSSGRTTTGAHMLINRVLYGAVAGGALLLTLPGTLRQEPTNPAAAGVKSPILLRTEEMN